MVINMAIGLAVQTDSAAIGVILLFFLFAFWAGEYCLCFIIRYEMDHFAHKTQAFSVF